VPEIARCTPQVDSPIQVIHGNQNWRTTYRGVSPEYLQIRKWPAQTGAVFTEVDVERRAKVCLLGKVVADMLFKDEDRAFRLASSLRV
jgi:putative ABC transport system permease protein